MNVNSDSTPEYLASSQKMLISAFPSGIPENDLPVVACVLGARLSARNIGNLFEISGYVPKGDGYYFAMSSLTDLESPETIRERRAIVDLLKKHGWNEWLKEHALPSDGDT